MFPLLTLFALSPHAEAGSAGAPAAPHALAELALVQADGSPLPSTAGKVVLFVNVASRCGFTPQYDGLQSLYAEYKDKGFLIYATAAQTSVFDIESSLRQSHVPSDWTHAALHKRPVHPHAEAKRDLESPKRRAVELLDNRSR